MAGACRLDAVLIGPLMTAQGVARHMGQRKPNAIATNSERLLLAVGFSTLAGPDSCQLLPCGECPEPSHHCLITDHRKTTHLRHSNGR
jgi:hypothetical protein